MWSRVWRWVRLHEINKNLNLWSLIGFFLIQPINEKCLWNWIDKSRQELMTIGQWKRKLCLNSSTEKSVKVKTDFFLSKRTGGFEQLFGFYSNVYIYIYIPLFWKPYTIVTKTNGLTLLMHNFLSRTTDVVNDSVNDFNQCLDII